MGSGEAGGWQSLAGAQGFKPGAVLTQTVTQSSAAVSLREAVSAGGRALGASK